MAAFVTVAEMEAALQRDLDEAAATEALDAACQMIRDYLGQQLDYVTNEVIRLHGTGRRTILLPELPVNAVDAVTVTDQGATTVLTVADWYVDSRSGTLFRVGTSGGPVAHGGRQRARSPTTTATPSSRRRVSSVAVSLASRLYHDAALSHPGMRSEQLGGHVVSYVAG